MLGSLTLYRRLLLENVFRSKTRSEQSGLPQKLPTIGHGVAGILSGWTVSFIAAPGKLQWHLWPADLGPMLISV